jgi:hypothetical protein
MNGNMRAIAIIGGIATIAAAMTAAEQAREWKDIHKFFVVVGGVAAILGMLG